MTRAGLSDYLSPISSAEPYCLRSDASSVKVFRLEVIFDAKDIWGMSEILSLAPLCSSSADGEENLCLRTDSLRAKQSSAMNGRLKIPHSAGIQNCWAASELRYLLERKFRCKIENRISPSLSLITIRLISKSILTSASHPSNQRATDLCRRSPTLWWPCRGSQDCSRCDGQAPGPWGQRICRSWSEALAHAPVRVQRSPPDPGCAWWLSPLVSPSRCWNETRNDWYKRKLDINSRWRS